MNPAFCALNFRARARIDNMVQSLEGEQIPCIECSELNGEMDSKKRKRIWEKHCGHELRYHGPAAEKLY